MKAPSQLLQSDILPCVRNCGFDDEASQGMSDKDDRIVKVASQVVIRPNLRAQVYTNIPELAYRYSTVDSGLIVAVSMYPSSRIQQ